MILTFKNNNTSGYFFDGELIESIQSNYQKIEVFNTLDIGKILTIDNYVQFSENDEFIYQELISHPANELIKNKEKALIIGGGDGLVARELLKYNYSSILNIEIDEKVSFMTQKHFPNLIENVFDNPRLHMVYSDAFAFNNYSTYDFICLDLNDPTSEATSLNIFTQNFLKLCSNILNPNGVLSIQITCPYTLPHIFNSTIKHLKNIFPNVFIIGYYIRSYGTYNYFAICTNQEISFDSFKSIKPDSKIQTKFYNFKMKNSCLALPHQIIL